VTDTDRDHAVEVAVIGLGRIGLPMAVLAAERYLTVGVDTDTARADAVALGDNPFEEEPGLGERLARVVMDGRLTATDALDYAAADVILIDVPLGLTPHGRPDFAALDAAVQCAGAGIRRGTLVVIETTVPVGTTRGRVAPALERASGMTAGVDFHVAYSPERVLTGRVLRDLATYPKLVGGLDDVAADGAREFYAQILQILPGDPGVIALASAEAAELTKLAETTARSVNIALACEFADRADALGVSYRQVATAANTQPYASLLIPGFVGGHCLPVYPTLLTGSGYPTPTPVIDAAMSTHTWLPWQAVRALIARLDFDPAPRILVLGAAYRPGVRDTTGTPAREIVRCLDQCGAARVVVHDPLLTDEEITAAGFTPHTPGEHVAGIVVATPHREFGALRGSDFPGLRVVADLAEVLDPADFPDVEFVRPGRETL
jgi:UDP-N-acetyl-D-glucosamine dehydrogenase